MIKLTKDNIHKELKVNQAFYVYPAYDEKKNFVDFQLEEIVKMDSKIFMPIIIFTIGSILMSILFVLIDKVSFMNSLSDIVVSIPLLILFLSTGILGIRRAFINKETLIPAKAIIHDVRIVTFYDFDEHPSPPQTHINPIYRVEVNNQIYQFLGEINVTEEDKGKEVVVYYDKKTMQFFDNPKSSADMIMGTALIVFSVFLVCSLFKTVFKETKQVFYSNYLLKYLYRKNGCYEFEIF